MSLKDSHLLSPAVAVWSLAALLLLAAGSPLLQSQNDTAPVGTESFSIPDRGGRSTTSSGTAESLRQGYGRIRADAGSSTPSGIAIFGLRQDGVLIAEAGVPATEPVQEGRVFSEVDGPVNTGLAIANPNDMPATIRFYFTDTSGTRFADGSFALGAHQQTAKFLDQAPFNSGSSVLGTFTFTSSVPVAVVALRGFTNEAGEFLMTTLPVAPLVGPPSPFSRTPTDTVYFPHFADGNGWETQVILVNPTDRAITGMVGFLEPGSGAVAASPVVLTLDDGSTGSDFDYSIPPRSVQKFTTSNPTGRLAVGSVRATPSSGNAAPSGLVVFSYAPDGKTVSEAGVPALPKGTAFRTYVEASGTPGQAGSIRSGLAITNTAYTSNTVTLEVTRLDGSLAVAPETLSLPPSGQIARFIDDIFTLPGNFAGVLRVTSTGDVAVVGLRLRINENGELKMTTTSPSNEMDPSISEDRFFAHLADSEGWSTQFILFSGAAGQAASGTLSFIDASGQPLDLPTDSRVSEGLAPPDERAFNSRMVGNRLNAETFFTDFVSSGRFIESGGRPGSYSYANTGPDTGTLTLAYDRADYGGACTVLLTFASATTGSLHFTCRSGIEGRENWSVSAIGTPPAPQVAARSGTDTELEVTFTDSFEAGEARAYDFEARTKTPAGSWSGGCNVFTNTASNAGTVSLTQGITGLQPGTVYEVRYRYRNASACDSGSPGQWSEVGEGATSGGGADTQLAFSDGTSATRAIPENIPPGINVGEPVSAVGGDALKYAISGTDARSFVIVPDTGQIRTREGVAYDYETKNRYSVTVGVEDGGGNRDTIDVTIRIENLVSSCEPPANFRVNYSDERLTLRWSPLSDTSGSARVLGYETEIRHGTNGAWSDRRTFLGRNIDAMIYVGLDNEIGYQVRVRPINAEGDCQWSTPVSGIPTADHAPEDDDDYHDRFGPHPVGTPERNLRLLTPGRCRHTSNGQTLDADCDYENTGPDSGRIFLEFDDPSQGSCEITLAYSSLTAGSFIDECFDAGVNTNVPFDRSFRMPPLSEQDGEVEVPRAPRSQEEFDVLAWGRDDFIPGLGFGCPPGFEECEFSPGNGYTVGRDSATGLPLWTLGDYTYMNTGPSTGVLTFRNDVGGRYTFTLDFGRSDSVRATIEAPSGGASIWPGMPHLNLTLGAQPVLLPIPPSWSAAIAIETDVAPDDWDGLEDRIPTPRSPVHLTSPRDNLLVRTLFAGLANAVAGGGAYENNGLSYTFGYEKLGRNRATISFDFREQYTDDYDRFDQLQQTLIGSIWVFDLTFTSDGAAKYTLTITKDGHLPTVLKTVVDFHGDGINLDEFPDELLPPDDPPQASGEDVSGVEVAAALTVTRIDGDDVQTLLVSDSGATYRPGDWLEPKDGSNQRMMIVGASQVSAVASAALSPDASPQFDPQILKTQTPVSSPGSPQFATAMAPFGVKASPAAALTSSSTITQLSVVCMQQIDRDIPTRGARYFSQPKTAQDAVQLCQQKCVLDGLDNIQGCVWSCEANAGGN